MGCAFCQREIANAGSLKAHENSCKENPNRVSYERSSKAGKQKGSVPWNKGLKTGYPQIWKDKYPDDEIFVKNSTYARHSLKRRILDDEKIPYVCSCCGIGPEWQGKPMPLILDHINGINNDNRLDNLRFVCSNCDTQLDTYKAKNKGNWQSG